MINRSDIEKFRQFLEEYDIIPNEKIGQHFLIDPEALDWIAGRTLPGASVIEIGSGIGNLTALLAQRAQAVLGLEVDRQFEPVLAEVVKANPNVTIQFTDALRADFNRIIGKDPDSPWQVASNPPYHIFEPLLRKLAETPIDSAVLLVGDSLAAAMTAEMPGVADYTKTSFITQALFHPDVIADVPRESFYPQPRTRSKVVELTPKEDEEFRGNRSLAIQRQLAAAENQQVTVIKAIKTALDSMEIQPSGKRGLSKREIHQSDRRAARQDLRQLLLSFQSGQSQTSIDRRSSRHQDPAAVIAELDLPDEILSQPFSHLDNQAVRILAQALMNL